MKKKFLSLLTLLCIAVTGAWADETIADIDFTSSEWSGKTFSQGNTTTSDVINNIYFYAKNSNSTKQFSLTDNTTKGLTFPDNNMSSGNYYFCIPLTGINKKITVTLKHAYSSNKASFKYAFADGRTEYVAGNTNGSGGTQVTDAAAADTEISFTINVTNASGHLFIARQSSNYPNILGVKVTTPATSSKPDPGLSVSPAFLTLAMGDEQQITATATSTGSISYESDNTNVATVDESGLITAVGVGNATITTSIAETDSYASDYKLTNVIVTPTALTITKYATFNGSLSSTPSGYFTITETSDGGVQYNPKYAGTYAGTDYASGLKFQNPTSVNFTTTSVCDLVVVQSLWSTQLIKIDGTTFVRNFDTNTYYDDATNKVRVYTVKNLAAGSHSITRNSEFGMLYIGVTESLAPSLSVSPTAANAFSYVFDNGPSAAQTFEVSLENSSKAVSATLTGDYEMSKTGEANSYASDEIIDLANASTLYVRLKAGLSKGTHNGTLTFSNDDVATDVEIALSGSVTNQTYAVTYDLNGGEGDAPTESAKEEGAEFTLAAAPTRTCYTFAGWKCNIDNVTYNASANYTMTDVATTFTAQWAANYSSSLDFSAVVEAETTGSNPIATFLASGNMVAENLGSGSAWETSTEKSGFIGYKLKDAGAKVSFLAQADKLVTIVLGSVGDAATLKKGSTSETIAQKKGDNAETVLAFVTAEDMVVSLTTTTTQTVTLKKIMITDYATATVGAKGYATFVNSNYALDFTGKSIKAYTISSTDGQKLTLTNKNKVAKGEPVLLYSETASDSQFIPAIDESEATADDANKLVAGTGAAITWTDTDKFYILYTGGENPGFYAANNSVVAVGKAYLNLSGLPTSARSFSFDLSDGEATGIAEIEAMKNVGNEKFYNLSGQRVAQPTKGLFIVNGKKVIIK